MFERGVGIDLRRRDALMAQQLLDALQSRAVVQHGCRKGVAQHVGRPFLQRGDRRQILMHDGIHLISRHPLSLVAQEQRLAVLHHLGIADGHIAGKRLAQFGSEGDYPLFVPLTSHLQLTYREIHIFVIEPRQFRTS